LVAPTFPRLDGDNKTHLVDCQRRALGIATPAVLEVLVAVHASVDV
jgi:hypothetical protein